MINVNLIKSTKLGKIEKLTLLALLEQRKDRMSDVGIKYPEGNNREKGILKGKMRHERAGIHGENSDYRPLKKR